VRLNIARVAEDPVRAARLPEGPSRMTFYSGGDWDPVSMEGRDRVRRQSSVEGLVRMKTLENDTYNGLVRSLFSSLLSLGPDTMKELWPGKKKKKSNAGTQLTEERVTAIYKVIEYLGLDTSVQEEGVFRKNAAVKKKDELLQRLEEEQQLDLYQEQFTVHEAASALKSLLNGLAEPPMTDCCFPALCSLATRERGLWLQGVRLLLQLVPGPESRLLKDLLHMLHGTAARETANRMSSSSLATIFMTHLVCPRWLPPEKLQALYSPLTALTTFMVEEAEQLFLVPPELVSAVEDITRRRSSQGCVSLARQEEASGVSSLIASTVFSFVERGNCLDEGDPVLTQLRIHRQILDLNSLPPTGALGE